MSTYEKKSKHAILVTKLALCCLTTAMLSFANLVAQETRTKPENYDKKKHFQYDV